MNCCLKKGFLKYVPNSRVPDDREDCFHGRHGIWRNVQMVWPFFSLSFWDFPSFLIYWMHRGSPRLFDKQPVSLSHLLHSQFQIRKDPHRLTPLLWRQVSPVPVHQPAKVCILQIHLKTRRYVGFRISSHPAFKFPFSYEYPRAFGYSRIFRR